MHSRISRPIAGLLLLLAIDPVDALPPAPAGWHSPNPYREGDAASQTDVIAHGARAFAQHCSKCHSLEDAQINAEGPDLRRLDSFCRRLKAPALALRCQFDVDSYFVQSVQEGKVRAGVVHMPPWRDLLAAETVWAIKRYVETRPVPKPRVSTSIDAARAAESQ